MVIGGLAAIASAWQWSDVGTKHAEATIGQQTEAGGTELGELAVARRYYQHSVDLMPEETPLPGIILSLSLVVHEQGQHDEAVQLALAEALRLPHRQLIALGLIVNELVIYILVNILVKQRIEMFEQALLVKTIFTLLFGMLVYQLLTLFLREEPIEATRRPAGW